MDPARRSTETCLFTATMNDQGNLLVMTAIYILFLIQREVDKNVDHKDDALPVSTLKGTSSSQVDDSESPLNCNLSLLHTHHHITATELNYGRSPRILWKLRYSARDGNRVVP